MDTWNDQDAAALANYSARNPKFLSELQSRLAEIKTDGTMEQGAMSGARHAGGEDMLSAIRDMQGNQGDVRSTPFIKVERD